MSKKLEYDDIYDAVASAGRFEDCYLSVDRINMARGLLKDLVAENSAIKELTVEKIIEFLGDM